MTLMEYNYITALIEALKRVQVEKPESQKNETTNKSN